MKFLLQDNLINAHHREQFKEALIQNNIPFQAVGMIPFTHDFLEGQTVDGVDWIPYGSTNMTTLALDLGFKGLAFNPELFRVDVCDRHRDDMLNSDAKVLSVEQAAYWLGSIHYRDQDWFIRPNDDLKAFSGTVMQGSEISDWFKDAMNTPDDSGSYHLGANRLVVVSKPKNIEAEWRWFVVGGKVIDGSLYRNRGRLKKSHVEDPNLIQQAQEFANGWLPHENVCMDLAMVDDIMKIVEFNTINSSGFYDNDVNKIVCALWEYYK